MAKYKRADQVESMAKAVMEEHYPILDQRGPRFEYVMTKPNSASGSVPDWKIRKITGIHAYVALSVKPEEFGYHVEPFVVIEVSESYWSLLREVERREAFLDHVLGHFWYDYEKGAWSVEGPEFGEFAEVLKRRGFWRPDHRLRRFARTMSEQLSLLDDEALEADVVGHEVVEEEGEEGEAPQESFDVSITHSGRTAHTNTETLRKMAAGEMPMGARS